MMPIGFSFAPSDIDATGEALKGQQGAAQEIENQNKQYAQRMERAANRAFMVSLDAKGIPDFQKYREGLMASGAAFNPAHAAMAYDYLSKTMKTTGDIGQSMMDVEGGGMTPTSFTAAPKAKPAQAFGDPSAAIPDAGPTVAPRVNDSIGESQSATGYGQQQAPAPHWSEAMFPVKPDGEVQVNVSPLSAPPVPETQYEPGQSDFVNEMLASRKVSPLGELVNAEEQFQQMRGGSVPGLVNAPGASGINPSTQVRDNAAAWMASKGRLIDGDVDKSWQALNQEAYEAAANAELAPLPNRSLLSMGREGRVKYQEQVNAYNASMRKADAAGQKAQLELSAALSEGNTKKADAIISSRAASAVVDGREYAARSAGAADTVRKLAPIQSLSDEAHDLLAKPRTYQDLKQLAPMITKITSAILTPGGGITDGMIKETEKSALGNDDASLGHIAVMLGLQFAAQKSGDKAAQASAAKQLNEFLVQLDPMVAQRNLAALLHAADKGLQDHYRANLIGYQGKAKSYGTPIGEEKTFPNGKVGQWDGQGWKLKEAK